jgi:hypothetical protein
LRNLPCRRGVSSGAPAWAALERQKLDRRKGEGLPRGRKAGLPPVRQTTIDKNVAPLTIGPRLLAPSALAHGTAQPGRAQLQGVGLGANAGLFEVRLSQIGDDRESGGLAGKDLGLLPHSKLFEPGSHRRFFALAPAARTHPSGRALVCHAIIFSIARDDYRISHCRFSVQQNRCALLFSPATNLF